ncbi:Protein of unknown function [Pyronema omphalodes CBS 100304]|uniref:Uncharacterized protein n=1 Tax=Pyronema omphalodes (strain CBS 100304) TaxID=1076935 RepID=U4LIP1_PYROM|nr:Protein of unknown function [Pyronema omphalodes CBS 100304]
MQLASNRPVFYPCFIDIFYPPSLIPHPSSGEF